MAWSGRLSAQHFSPRVPLEGTTDVQLLGRLKPGVTREQATAALHPIFEDMRTRHPDNFPAQWSLRLRTFGETFPSGIQDALWILFGAVGVLLLIACTNVSNLLLTRAAYRRREIGIRIALGATFQQVVGMVLGSGARLMGIGVVTGLAASLASVKVLRNLVSNVSTFDPYSFAIVTVLLFTAGLFASFWPALKAARVDPVTALREE